MTKTVVLESSYYGANEEFEFEVDDSATEDEINEIAYQAIIDNIEWYVKD